MDKSNDASKENSVVKFLKTTGKFVGCVVLGTVLTAFHYVFDLIAAPLGVIYRTIFGCIRLYSKTKPKGFLQHIWFIFKSLFLLIYNLIKLPFLLIYRATFGLVEHAVGIIEPMRCLFRGDKIVDKVNIKESMTSNKFVKYPYKTNISEPVETNKLDSTVDDLVVINMVRRNGHISTMVDINQKIKLTDNKSPKYCGYNSYILIRFALASLEFESPLFNNPENHGKFKRFFTGIWDTVHTKFGNFAEWLLIPKIDSNDLITTNNVNVNDDNNTKEDMQSNSSASKKEDDKFDIFDNILYPIKFSEKEPR